MSANNSITLALNVLGLQDTKEAVSVLTQLRDLSGHMAQGGVYPAIQGPIQQGTQGVNMYEDINKQLTAQFKNIQTMNEGMQAHEDSVLKVGRAYALLNQQAAQLDGIFSRWRSDDRYQAMSDVAGFARSSGQNAVQYGAQMAQFQQMGAISNSGQMSDLSGILAQAVEKGSTSAYRLQYQDILPYLTSLSQQAMLTAPMGANVGGIASSLTALNQAAPGLRGGGAAQAYSAISGDISGGGGYAGVVALQTYQQQNPGKGYGSFMYDRETAAQDPDFFNQYIANLFNSMGGQESDPETKKMQLAFISKQTGLSAHALDAITTGLADYDPATKQLKAKPGVKFDDLKKKYGAAAGANDAMLPYLAMADNARGKGGDELNTALQNYRDATGDTSFVPKGDTTDAKAADLATHIAQSKSTFGNNRGDQMAQSQADQANQMVLFGQGVRDSTQAMQGLNTAIGTLTTSISGNPIGGAAFGLSQGTGQVVGGAMQGVMSGLSTALLMRSLGGAAGNAGGGIMGALGKLILPSKALTIGGEAADTAAGGGGAMAGELAASAALPLGMIAAGGYVGYQALHEQPKRDAAEEAKRTEADKESRYQTYEKDKNEGGPLAALLHPKYLFMDDAQTKDIQARETRDKQAGVTPGGTPTAAAASPAKTQSDDILKEMRAQTALLSSIDQRLATNYDRGVIAAHPVTSTAQAAQAALTGRAAFAGATAHGAAGVAGAGAGAPGGAPAGPVQGNWGNPDDAQIQKVLNSRGKSPLAMDDIKKLSAKYNVPVGLVLAHLGMESGWGTDEGTLKENHNYLGLTGKGTNGSVQVPGVDRQFASFNSDYEGLEAGIANMASSQYQGLSLQEYLALYLTGNKKGTGDEKGNKVSDYMSTVLGIVNGQFGGNVGTNSIPISPRGSGTASGQGKMPLGFTPGDIDVPAMKASTGIGDGTGLFFGTVAVVIDNKVDGTKDTKYIKVGRGQGGPFANILNAPTGTAGLV